MNKTLDVALINKKIPNEQFDLNKFDIQTDDLKSIDTSLNLSFSKNKYVIPAIEIQDASLSILNQSIINVALFEEESDTCSDNQNQNLTNLKENINNINYFSSSVALLKVSKLHRSFSQGENVLPKRPKYLKRTSSSENIQTEHKNNSGISSPLDFLNEGFLKSGSIGSSLFSSLTSISSITTLNSTSSAINTSLMVSNGTLNRTFLESSSEKSDNTKVNENQRSTSGSDSIVSTSKDLVKPVTNNLNKTKSTISDLTDQLNKLKANDLKLRAPENNVNKDNKITYSFSNNAKECVTVVEKKEECDTNNRLIDVDLFSPESNYSTDQCNSSILDVSTDSVFLDARTFEETALKTNSGSSVDDQIPSNPLWTSELLPPFHDEVDNSIELPTYPNINNVNSNHGILPENVNEEPIVNKSTEILVSSNGNINENIKMVNNDIEIEQISKASKLKYENKTHSLVLLKSANRLSLDLESKQINKPLTGRSISVSQTINVDKGKSTVVEAVKNKLNKTIGGDIINKKGAMKAIIPIGNVQKRDCINKKINPSTDTTTPSKTYKIISSTPNSMVNQISVKKPMRPLNPVASSTPDAQNAKTRKIPFQINNEINKRNFGCDFSPVTTRVNAYNSNGVNCSPKRFGKMPSPKRTTQLVYLLEDTCKHIFQNTF